MRAIAMLSWILLVGCDGSSGTDGKDGADGAPGAPGADGAAGQNGEDGLNGVDGVDGQDGQDGQDGKDGEDGEDGLGVEIDAFHGTDAMLSSGDFAEGKFYADLTIDDATADASGQVTVDFTVLDEEGLAVVGITSINATVAKLEPPATDESFNRWVSYIYRVQEVTGSDLGDWPNPDGTQAEQAYRESSGTLTDHGDGTYTYVYATDISSVVTPVDKTVIDYERSLTHRVALELGGSDSATADASFDFVPDGSAITETRDIVDTTVCQSCHGIEFSAHGGDRLSVGDCVTCHQPGTWDPQGGETVDMKVMIHKIHAGSSLASIPGEDGQVWDDPETAEDETADNGEYAIWGYGNAKTEWWDVGFPAEIANCTKCHTGTLADVDNWKNVPSRDACGSCHDDVDFTTGLNHSGGAQDTDDDCAVCHHPDTESYAISVADAHDFLTNDPRNIPEFDVDVSISPPLNKSYYEDGEAPLLTIVINEDGAPIDHTTILQDLDGAEGCTVADDPCPTRDGNFDHVYLMVHGPRGQRAPVLTTPARLEVLSLSAGPFDLTAKGATLELVFDGGEDIKSTYDTMEADVSIDVASGVFVDLGAATADEISTWLNADAAFYDRAFAYVNESGLVAIRDRKLGSFPVIELVESEVATQVFGGAKILTIAPTAYYVKADVKQFSDPALNDPKATWSTGNITYALDPVDDLAPGTYVASMEIADAGRIDDDNYRAPSVTWITFQVGQADGELPPADNCDECHQNVEGDGLVFDPARHYKLLGQDAIDQCGACHDYTDRDPTGDAWAGAYPISRRVHAVHYGAHLTYPVDTVGHDDVPAGRFWNIEFPQDIRYCDQTCHRPETTSGTWKTAPARVPCMGCHDSDAAVAHMTIMTVDPTPESPWSGDEQEACEVCHASADE
jgi:hypothetical protein